MGIVIRGSYGVRRSITQSTKASTATAGSRSRLLMHFAAVSCSTQTALAHSPPEEEANFGFGTSGQITELNVKIGDTVDAGQVIGQIDNSESFLRTNRPNALSMTSQPRPQSLKQSRRCPGGS